MSITPEVQTEELRKAMRITRQKDFVTGLVYLAIGFSVAGVANGYRMGTASAMGPGYFPFWVGILLALMGAVLLVGATRGEGEAEQTLQGLDLRSLSIVSASIILFGIALTYLGLVAAVVVLVLVSSLASRQFNWKTTILNIFALQAITFLIFVFGLKLQFRIWPAF